MKRSKIASPAKLPLSESLLLEGDVHAVLPLLPDESIQCVVTSPPYWGLRDYGIYGQIGLEDTLAGYLLSLTNLFAEVRRVLRADGVLWLNIGDGFTSGNRGWRAADKKNPNRAMSTRPDNPPGLKDKDLLGVPWRLAFALQADGWFLRSDIIWHKPNAMPESVKDRPTRAHEYLFMLTKSERYAYYPEAVMEEAEQGRRNRRSVWSINTAPSLGAHVASFPPELVEPCILASSQPDDFVLDPFFGVGTVGLVAKQLRRRFVGIELNPEYVTEAERVLSSVSNGSYRRPGIRYTEPIHEHQPALLEPSGKYRVRTRRDSETIPPGSPRRRGAGT